MLYNGFPLKPRAPLPINYLNSHANVTLTARQIKSSKKSYNHHTNWIKNGKSRPINIKKRKKKG